MDNNKDKEKIMEIVNKEKYKEAKTVRKIVFITTAIIFLLLAGILTGGYLYIHSALKPVDPDSKQEVQVEIPMGSGTSAIASILEKNRVIKDALVFKYYVKFKNETDFQAGTYLLSPSMTMNEIITSLKTGSVYKKAALSIPVPEGLRLTEIAGIIAKKTDYSTEEIVNTVNSPEFIKKAMETYPELITEDVLNENIKFPLEGYLFPATYSFEEKKPPLEEILLAMIKKTNDVVEKYRIDLESKGITVHQLLTLASLVEEEATNEADRKTIASVFYNRMETGMPLQTDPTVIYAIGEHRDWLTFKDYYEVVDPYNTYLNSGYPPGPIAGSSEMSIEAALYPASSDYYYFLATPKGEVLFSKTLEEHNEKYAQYIQSNQSNK